MKRNKLDDIESAKGLAIFLVVLGHITLGSYPEGNRWYLVLYEGIYKFHMPFFLFISGFLMFYTYPGLDSRREYFAYIKSKFFRLMPAFVVFAIIIGFGKFLVGGHLHVDNRPDSLFSAFSNILIKPSESHARSLWYIYVLFFYFMAFPIIFKYIRELRTLIVIGLLLYFIPFYPDWFALGKIKQYFLVFAMGILAASKITAYYRIIGNQTLLFVFIFVASFSVLVFNMHPQYEKLIIGVASIPALHGIMNTETCRNVKFFKMLGKYTFSIYLMNTIVIGVFKGFTLKLFTWDGYNFLAYAPLALACGLIIPIGIKKLIFSNIPVLDKMTD